MQVSGIVYCLIARTDKTILVSQTQLKVIIFYCILYHIYNTYLPYYSIILIIIHLKKQYQNKITISQNPKMYTLQQNNISPYLLNLVQTSNIAIPTIKQYLRKLIKELKNPQSHNQNVSLLKQTLVGIVSIFKDNNMHPRIKFNTHKIIMYLLLLADLDVYKAFQQTVYPIIRSTCIYNKALKLDIRGQDFYKKSKFYTDPKATQSQKTEIKKYGCSFIIFCLQTIYQLAKWLPFDLQQDTKPTKFSISYENLRKQKVEFPKQQNFQFYINTNLDQIQKVIKEVQGQFQSVLDSQIKSNSIMQLDLLSKPAALNTQLKKQKQSLTKKSIEVANSPIQANNDMQNNNKIFLLQDQKNKLLKEIQIQRNYFQGQLQKQMKIYQENIYKYEKKITSLQEDIQKMKRKLSQSEAKFLSTQPNSKTFVQLNDKNKDKTIDDLQNLNKILLDKNQKLEQDIKKYQLEKKQNNEISQASNSSVPSAQFQKLKKQNRSLKAKLLTQCSESSEFSTNKNGSKTRNLQKQPQALKFLGYQEARTSFQPFYSNSSSQKKIRLRKAILRQKQLLYRDKTLQIGCITKLQTLNSIRLITVFTNISQKPLYNFSTEFVSREDLVIKLVQNTKNYLQISGQAKSQIVVTINQIDFRCLLCSIRFNLQQQTQKVALIMPISKLKIAQQLVYTPIKKQQKMKKLQRVFQYDRKMLPNIHKFKQYFDLALLEVDKTMHQTYNMKIQFMNSKFNVECDQIQGELRIAVKYYEEQDLSKAQKFLQELVFLFMKN